GLEHIVGAWFFPSGDRLLLTGNEAGHGVRGYIRDLAGGPLRPVAPEGTEFRRGAISKDGRRLVGIVLGGGATIYPVDGGPPRPVPGFLPSELSAGWSADGKAIYAFRPATNHLDLDRVDLATGARTLWTRITTPEGSFGVTATVLVGADDQTYTYMYRSGSPYLFYARGLE